MGKQAKLVGGIKARLQHRRKKKGATAAAAAAAASSSCYHRVEKTNSMKVEMSSRRAQGLIAKNLAAADSTGGGNKKAKKWAFLFEF